MSYVPVLPTPPSQILMKFSTKIDPCTKQTAQNISDIPAIICKLHELYFLPQINRKNAKMSQSYFKRPLLVFYLPFSGDIDISSMLLPKDLKTKTFFI